MKAKALVLEEFNKPLTVREFEVSPLSPGDMLVRVEASGVCGSDFHMLRGNDPRTPLPIILGHEGVGIVEDIRGEKEDILGRRLSAGDRVIWDRGIACGRCFFCAVKGEPSLCSNRRVYGISFSCKESPHLLGCYSEYIHLLDGTKVLRLDGDVDPGVLVSASCSGATAAHALDLCEIREGDTVVIQGPGPLGIFCLAFAIDRGASRTVVIGTKRSEDRLKMCEEFGATDVLIIDGTRPKDRVNYIKEITNGFGADVVIECSGNPQAFLEGVKMVAPGGTYLLPGVAAPAGDVPLDIYWDLVRRNVRLQGVWVSDTSHLYRAVNLVMSGRCPFENLAADRFPLEDANRAIDLMGERRIFKAILSP
ncbi:MAG: zinc-binding dehydrogenase [bacterium]